MKTKLLFAKMLFVLSVYSVSAQIPNSGFESWVHNINYSDPTEWATMNPYCSGPFYSCTQSTDHYPVSFGSYSIRLENNTSLTQFTGGYGMAITNAFDYPFKPAFPVTGSPTSLTGYYKYNSLNNDTMFIRIVLFQNGTMLGYNTFKTGITASTWTSFSLPITYTSVDSATIHISAFYPSSQSSGPKGNSVLFVDNLNFDVLIGTGIAEYADLKNSNYPNPAQDILTIQFEKSQTGILNLFIYDETGRMAECSEMERSLDLMRVDVSALSAGMYFYEIRTSEGIMRNKFVKQ